MPEARLDPTALEIIASTPAALRSLLASVPAGALSAPVDDGWSAKDVVAHLLDAQSVAFTERIRRILCEDRPIIRPIDPSKRLHERDYASWPLDRILNEFERVRSTDVDLMRGLSNDDLQRVGQHEQAGEISVSDLANYCAAHDMMHLRQIAGMLLTQVQDRVGGMRMFIGE